MMICLLLGATEEAVNNDDSAGGHIIIPEDTVLRAYHEATQAIYAQMSKNIMRKSRTC